MTAVGEPPADKICFFRHLKNVVVLPSKGMVQWTCLLMRLICIQVVVLWPRCWVVVIWMGKLRGVRLFAVTHLCYSDLYSVIKYSPLLPSEHADPASYASMGTRALPDGRTSTVDDICDFIVEYINSDVLVRVWILCLPAQPNVPVGFVV